MISSDSGQHSMMSLLFRLGGTLDPQTDEPLLTTSGEEGSFASLLQGLQSSTDELIHKETSSGHLSPLLPPATAENRPDVGYQELVTGTVDEAVDMNNPSQNLPSMEMASDTPIRTEEGDDALVAAMPIINTKAESSPIPATSAVVIDKQLAALIQQQPAAVTTSEDPQDNRLNVMNTRSADLLPKINVELSQADKSVQFPPALDSTKTQAPSDPAKNQRDPTPVINNEKIIKDNRPAGSVADRPLASVNLINNTLAPSNEQQPAQTGATAKVSEGPVSPQANSVQQTIVVNNKSPQVTPNPADQLVADPVVSQTNTPVKAVVKPIAKTSTVSVPIDNPTFLPIDNESTEFSTMNSSTWQNPNESLSTTNLASDEMALRSAALIRSNLQTAGTSLNDAPAMIESSGFGMTASSSTFTNQGGERLMTNLVNEAAEVSEAIEQAQLEQDDIAAETMKFGQDRREWSGALGQRIMTMVAQDIQQARIQLDPPELGALEIKLQVQQDQASVQVHAQHGQVREVLEQNIFRLKEALQQQGIELTDSEFTDAEQNLANQGSQQQESSERSLSSTATDQAETNEDVATELDSEDNPAKGQITGQQGIINQQGRLDTFV